MGYRYKVLHCLYPYTTGVRRYWLVMLVSGIAATGLGFVTPILYKSFVNDVILRAKVGKMGVIVIGYLTVFLAGAAAGYVKNWARYTLVNSTTYRVRQRILRHFFKIDFPEYEKVSVGDLKMRIEEDTAKVAAFADSQTIDLFLHYITMIISACALLRIHGVLAVFSMTAIPLTFWLDHLLSRQERKLTDRFRENGQETASWLHAMVQGWREVKALDLSVHETRRYYRFLHKDMLCNAKWINYWTARVLMIPKLKDEFFMQFGLYFIGGFLIISGNLQIGDLLVFAVYHAMLSDAIQAASLADADLRSWMPCTDRLMESLTGWESQNPRGKESGQIPDRSNTIVFEDVSFSYPDTGKAVLEHFNLTIKKGERIAIVGKSGCGKTTLLKLMTGMLIPDEGKVSFSGMDLLQTDVAAMHDRIGYIMQENALFHTTIRENLLLAKENATEQELWEACRHACMEEFVAGLEQGLDTVIGEKGIRLSGGQRQRVVLARMFLRDIDIFIFDEATSALDPYTEHLVQEAIANIPKEKTVIIVAHRESATQMCDRIVTL